LKLKVKTVFLLIKAHDEELIGKARDVTEWLLSKDGDTPYIVYVPYLTLLFLYKLTGSLSYVENTLEHNHIFDAKDLISREPSYEGRLKYWTNELCRKHPHTFDFIVTVGASRLIDPSRRLHQHSSVATVRFSMPVGSSNRLFRQFCRWPWDPWDFLPSLIMMTIKQRLLDLFGKA
jgi:NAD+ kinase